MMSKPYRIEPLLQGEKALENAPHTELDDGLRCIPQHYLSYQHTLETVEQLVLNMSYSDKYLMFVSQDKAGIYIQIGVIGYDNYKARSDQSRPKIVYGRKWRVEPQLPSSEIIQTVFLAIKKAREHEIRELFRITQNNYATTPFNNHHDTPLLVRSHQFLSSDQEYQRPINEPELEMVLKSIRYDKAEFKLVSLEPRKYGRWLVDLEIVSTSDTQLPELNSNTSISYLIRHNSLNQCLYGLMQALIELSDRHVDEHFLYDGVARFSWEQSMRGIACLSRKTRQLHLHEEKQSFTKHWKQFNYETDLTRVPTLSASELSKQLKKTLEMYSPLEGVLPQ